MIGSQGEDQGGRLFHPLEGLAVRRNFLALPAEAGGDVVELKANGGQTAVFELRDDQGANLAFLSDQQGEIRGVVVDRPAPGQLVVGEGAELSIGPVEAGPPQVFSRPAPVGQGGDKPGASGSQINNGLAVVIIVDGQHGRPYFPIIAGEDITSGFNQGGCVRADGLIELSERVRRLKTVPGEGIDDEGGQSGSGKDAGAFGGRRDPVGEIDGDCANGKEEKKVQVGEGVAVLEVALLPAGAGNDERFQGDPGGEIGEEQFSRAAEGELIKQTGEADDSKDRMGELLFAPVHEQVEQSDRDVGRVEAKIVSQRNLPFKELIKEEGGDRRKKRNEKY